MEREKNGESWQQGHLGTHFQDEQASSDEEGFPLDQNGHPPIVHNSIYSRIQQEVQSRLPSIDFASFEANDESDDAVIGRYWPPDDINRALNVQGFVERPDRDVDGLPAQGLPERTFSSLANSGWSGEGSDIESEQASSECNSWYAAGRNCVNEKDGMEDCMPATLTSDNITGNAERVGDQEVEARRTLETGKNDLIGKVSAIDRNVKSLEDLGSGNITLQTDEIDEKNLDIVLGRDAILIDADSRLKIGNIPLIISNDNDDDDDCDDCDDGDCDDSRLLDRLSSFAVNEKNSVSESSILLEQLATPHDGRKSPGTSHDTILDGQIDDGQVSNVTKGRLMGENKTVFIDLRNACVLSSVENNQETTMPKKEDSSTDSESEDWMKIRQDIKSGLNVKRSRKLEGDKESKSLANKVHDRMTRRSYERLANHKLTGEMDYVLKRDSYSVDHGTNTEATRTVEKAAFDVGPLEEKIRSWHQLSNTNHNKVYSLLGDIRVGEKNTICRKDGLIDPCGCEEHDSVEGRAAVESVRQVETLMGRGNIRNVYTVADVPAGTSKVNDSSLLGLENVDFKSGLCRNARRSLLIVEEDKQRDSRESCRATNEQCTKEKSTVEVISDDSMKENNVEEFADKIRISDNLMVIKANISADLQNSQVTSAASTTTLNPCNEGSFNEIKELEAHNLDDPTATGNCHGNEGDCVPQTVGSRTSIEHCRVMALIQGNGNKLLTGASWQRDSQAGSVELETEMKTFSIAESNKCSFASAGEEMTDLSSTLKGLLPQYGRPMPHSTLNCKREAARRGRENEAIEKEMSVVDKQESGVTSLAESNAGHEGRQDNETIKHEEKGGKTTDTKCENSVGTTGTDLKAECGQSRSKKKSKKKNRRSADNGDDRDMTEGRNNDGRKVSKNNLDLKLAKNAGNIEKERKRKPVCLVRESERVQIEERIKQLQERVGEADVIFDKTLSFTHPFKSLPNSTKDGAKLLLKIRLQSPGVCSKSCAKNSLSFNERTDAYIGLCTLFLSLLYGSKFRVCDGLNIPFNVIALMQATIDSELQLLVGIIEYEIPMETAQQLKRGKPAKTKRNFFQTVTQYLNKTDLEKVLFGLMKFDHMQRVDPTAFCPGTRKLSSYITVSQDEAAVSRIFNLKHSLAWCKNNEVDHQTCDNVCWMKGKQKKNETTCVIVENIASMLPRTIATFMRTARNNSLDICGLRIAYVTKKDQSEEPALVAGFRGPNVTTVNEGKSFTADAQELKSVKSTYMLDSPCEDLKEVTVSASTFIAPFNVTIAEPLITYTIGRGRGEREVVNWFGRRTLTLADADTVIDQARGITSNSTSLPEKLDVLSRHAACAYLLTATTNRIVLSMSHFVPTVFISLAMTLGESRGLHAISAGKILLKEEDLLLMGLKTDNEEETSVGNKLKIGKVNQSVSLVVFEGENPMYRAYGFVRSLFDMMNGKLPRDALTKDAVVQTLKESSGYELVKQDRSIEEFFGVVQLNKKVSKILERMTAQNLSHLDNEVMNALPPNWKLFVLPETPRICATIFVGKPMLEIFPYILQVILSECLEDPFCINAKASTERRYRQQERPVAEIIGLKCYSNLSRHIAHVCCPYVVGAKHWATSVENLRKGPVVVLVARLLDTITSMDEKCQKISQHVCTLLRSNELNCSPDSVYDAFSYTHLDTVFRVLLGMFNADELMPDACPTWFKSTQWPVYLSGKSSIVKRIDPVFGFLTNAHQLQTFRSGVNAAVANPAEVQILSPLEMNIPAELILGKQVSLSFMEITVDCNFSKSIPRVLGILRRDMFDVVGLSFPSGFSPSFVSCPTMHVVLRRPDAVFRLNQWLPGLRAELHRNHNIRISLGAREAFDAIVRNFQKTESGGIFDDSTLSATEKLTFKNDDIYDCREYRRVHWRNSSNATMSSSTDSRYHTRPDPNRGFVMPEINVLIITNVMMRGTYLDDYISENAKVLGFWEHIASLGFRIIGVRMTSLNQEQVDGLLEKLKLPSKHHRLMAKRMPSSNGPIVALAVLRDFALSNCWNTVTKNLTEEECRIIDENILIPTTKYQVEILASSLFETLAPNPEIEIKRISALKECHVVS